VAERYSLLVIITLGGIVLGTTTAVDAVVSEQGEWTWDAVLVVATGLSLAFAMWWSYFGVRFGEALEVGPTRGFGFGYGHIPLCAAIAAVGAGLHVAAYHLGYESTLTETETILSVTVPVFAFVVILFGLAHWCLPGRDRFDLVLLLITSVLALGTVGLAELLVPSAVCLVVLMLAPWVLVVGYETRGHDHMERVLTRMRAASEGPNAPASSGSPSNT
jgi:low temperature requirement protein LtrA